MKQQSRYRRTSCAGGACGGHADSARAGPGRARRTYSCWSVGCPSVGRPPTDTAWDSTATGNHRHLDGSASRRRRRHRTASRSSPDGHCTAHTDTPSAIRSNSMDRAEFLRTCSFIHSFMFIRTNSMQNVNRITRNMQDRKVIQDSNNCPKSLH